MKYDVFISCKSEDYIYAEGIYKYLKDNGIKVFLASTELRRLGEAEYRRAISDALKGAYHIIVFASRAEYVDSGWVYYEWDMFVNAKLKGYKPGNIVTILKDIALDDINMDLWKYESMTLDDYQDRIIPYVETAESKARMQELENQRQKEAEKQRLEQAKIEKQIKLKRELVGLAEDYKKKVTNLSVDIAKIKDKRREAENITYRCPVCSEESSISDEYCNNCGWVFSPIEGIEGAEYLTKDCNPLVERMREIRAGKTDDSKQIKSLNTQIDNLKQELSTSRRDNGELSKQVVHLSDELSKLRKSQQSGQNQGGHRQSLSSFSLKNLFSWLKGLKKRYYLHLAMLAFGIIMLILGIYWFFDSLINYGDTYLMRLIVSCVISMYGVVKLLKGYKNGFLILLLNAVLVFFSLRYYCNYNDTYLLTGIYLFGFLGLYLVHKLDKTSSLSFNNMSKSTIKQKLMTAITMFGVIILTLVCSVIIIEEARKSDTTKNVNEPVALIDSPNLDSLNLIKAIEYLDKNEIWRADSLERYEITKGLFDELNRFDFDAVTNRKDVLSDSKTFLELCTIIENKETPSPKGTYLSDERDKSITPRFYINRVTRSQKIGDQER